jgi:serine/threonine-protein kinase RsbW
MTNNDLIWLDLPATHKYLNVLGACINEMLSRVEGLAEPAVLSYSVQLAVHEACANIIDHAYEGREQDRFKVALSLEETPRRFVAELYDSGRSFDLSRVPQPTLEDPQIHGYGLFLIQQLLDEVTYQPQSGNNYWRLVKNL